MSNSTNVEKNKNSKKFDIITILDKSKRARILFLITLGISGLGIRLYFSLMTYHYLMIHKDIFGMR